MSDAPAGPWSNDEFAEYLATWRGLSGAAKDTLRGLIYSGPLWDGDVPSKRGRDELLDKRLASKAVIKREEGYQVANYKGHRVYRAGNLNEYEPADYVAARAIQRAASIEQTPSSSSTSE